MKRFCKDLKEHGTEMINYEKNWYHWRMKRINHISIKKFVIYPKKGFSTDDDNKKYCKVRDHCHHTGKYRGAAHNICNLIYKTPKESKR